VNKKNFIMKVSAGGFPLNKFPSDHGKIITKYAGVS